MAENTREYETIDVVCQCLNCCAVWRVEHEVEKGHGFELRAELISCPLCYDKE